MSNGARRATTWLLGLAVAALVAVGGCDSRRAEAGEATCGKAGLKDCPLQAWMKTNLVKAKADGDFGLLAKNLARLPALAPVDSGWSADWKALAKKGIDAAGKADRDALNAACTECHTKYRKTYREKYREQSIPN